MSCEKLSSVLRAKADEIQNLEAIGDANRLDAAELIRVLARLVEGKSIYQSFGAPGDWGYGTPIGDALRAAYSKKEAA